MKRDIIFRGKTADNGEWIEGYLSEHNAINVQINDETVGFLTYDNYEVLPETVCQFTGLTDKNGVKIWEGSKVRGMSNSPFSVGKWREYTVIWGIDHWHIEGTYFTLQELFNHCNDNIEVIGHIHDNAELINN